MRYLLPLVLLAAAPVPSEDAKFSAIWQTEWKWRISERIADDDLAHRLGGGAFRLGEPIGRHQHAGERRTRLARVQERLLDAVGDGLGERRLVEIVELPDHPWFVASQFHPEFKSRPTRPAPLFREFVGAALERARTRAASGVGAAVS